MRYLVEFNLEDDEEERKLEVKVVDSDRDIEAEKSSTDEGWLLAHKIAAINWRRNVHDWSIYLLTSRDRFPADCLGY